MEQVGSGSGSGSATPSRAPTAATPEKLIILRHDVDLLPQNSLATAKLEHELGIRGSYYFRAVPDDGTRPPDYVSKAGMTQMLQIFTDLFFRRRALYSSQSHTKPHPYDPNIFNPKIIKEIASLGHEVGYHYETMDTVDGTQITQMLHLPDCRRQAGINTDKYLRNIEQGTRTERTPAKVRAGQVMRARCRQPTT